MENRESETRQKNQELLANHDNLSTDETYSKCISNLSQNENRGVYIASRQNRTIGRGNYLPQIQLPIHQRINHAEFDLTYPPANRLRLNSQFGLASVRVPANHTISHRIRTN